MQPQQIYDFSSDENSHKWRGLFVQALRKVTTRLLRVLVLTKSRRCLFQTRVSIHPRSLALCRRRCCFLTGSNFGPTFLTWSDQQPYKV